MNKRFLLYCGPLTVLIEWIGLLLGKLLAKDFNYDAALSTLTHAAQPLPLIFGVTLTLIGITYFLFSLALANISKLIPIAGGIAGAMFALAGWVPYTGNGGWSDSVHNTCTYVATLGYAVMIWSVKKHPHQTMQRISVIALVALVLTAIWSFESVASKSLVAVSQLCMLFIFQLWTILVVWHSRKLDKVVSSLS